LDSTILEYSTTIGRFCHTNPGERKLLAYFAHAENGRGIKAEW
jgi:hypothetical protein